MGVKLADALIYLRSDDSGLGGDLDKAEKKTTSWASGLGGTLSTLIGGAVLAGVAAVAGAIVGIGVAAFSASNQIDVATDNIQAQLGLTREEAERLGGVAADVWGNNFAGSIEEAGDAVAYTRQQLGDLADDELQRATESAFALSDVFGTDIEESVNTAQTLMDEFGLSSDEAFDFMASGMQRGLNSNGDFLDSIGEYSNLFGDAGFDADEFFSIMESGAKGGVLGTDKIADSIKEMNIILGEGSEEAAEAFAAATGYSFEKVQGFIRSGDEAWADYFPSIVDGLKSIEDPIERNRLQVELFGTMAEDLGPSFLEGLDPALVSLDDMAGATESLNAKYDNLGSFAEGMKRKLVSGLQPFGDKLLDIANNAMPAVEDGISFIQGVMAIFLEGDFVGEFWSGLGVQEDSPFIATLFNIRDAFTDTVSFVRDVAIPGFLDFKDRVLEAISPSLDRIKEAFGGAFGGGQGDLIGTVMSSLEEWIPIVVDQLVPGIGQLASWIADLAEVALPILATAIGFVTDNFNIIGPILAGVGVAILALSSPVTLIIGGIVLLATAWANNWGNIQGITEGFLSWFQDNLLPHIENYFAIFREIFLAFKSLFEGDFRGFGEHLRGAVDGIFTFWKEIWMSIGTFAIETITTAVTGITEFIKDTDWKEVGEDIIRGIGKGVQSLKKWLGDQFINVISGGVDAVKGFFNINSPSGKTADEVGEPIIEGVFQPIKRAKGRFADLMSDTLDLGSFDPSNFFGGGGQLAPQLSAAGAGRSSVQIDNVNIQLERLPKTEQEADDGVDKLRDAMNRRGM